MATKVMVSLLAVVMLVASIGISVAQTVLTDNPAAVSTASVATMSSESGSLIKLDDSQSARYFGNIKDRWNFEGAMVTVEFDAKDYGWPYKDDILNIKFTADIDIRIYLVADFTNEHGFVVTKRWTYRGRDGSTTLYGEGRDIVKISGYYTIGHAHGAGTTKNLDFNFDKF